MCGVCGGAWDEDYGVKHGAFWSNYGAAWAMSSTDLREARGVTTECYEMVTNQKRKIVG